jgi:hypothetical protein
MRTWGFLLSLFCGIMTWLFFMLTHETRGLQNLHDVLVASGDGLWLENWKIRSKTSQQPYL